SNCIHEFRSVDLHPQPQAIIYILDILVVLFSFQRANCASPFKMATLLIYHVISLKSTTFLNDFCVDHPEIVRPSYRGKWAWVDSNHRPHAYQACALTN